MLARMIEYVTFFGHLIFSFFMTGFLNPKSLAFHLFLFRNLMFFLFYLGHEFVHRVCTFGFTQ